MKKEKNINYIQKIYGVHASVACLNNPSREIIEVLCTDKVFTKHSDLISKFKYKILPIKVIHKNFNDILHQGFIVKAFSLYLDLKLCNLAKMKKIAILDKIKDPNNVGAIIRSAAVFDFDAIIITKHDSPIRSDSVFHVACGAAEYLNLIIVSNISNTIEKLEKIGFFVFGMDASSDYEIYDYKMHCEEKIAVVLGSEQGMSKLVMRRCHKLYKISIKTLNDLDSLNVSNAAAVVFSHLYKK